MELTKVISQSFINYMNLPVETEEDIVKNIEKAKGIYDIILSVFLLHEKDNQIQSNEVQKRVKFMYDILDHVNSLRLESNGRMSEYRLRFGTEILQFLYSKLSALSINSTYVYLLMNNLSFVVMVPKFSSKTQKTTIKL